jgi:hypothetical protein
MTTNSLLLIATLALAGVANAKSYDITLSAPMKAGSVQLAAGEYSLKHCCPNYQANCWPKQRMASPVKRLSP